MEGARPRNAGTNVGGGPLAGTRVAIAISKCQVVLRSCILLECLYKERR